jgi:uncharacterized protein (DUF1697 family)
VKVYISLLRGVNMAGHNMIKMTSLAEMFRNLGFTDAETFIQSGNIVFSDPINLPQTELAEKIEKSILDKFGLNIPAMMRSPEDLKKIISGNPFAGDENFNPERLAVIFLHDRPSQAQIDKVKDVNYPPDKFIIIGTEVYIYCPNGFGKSKIYTGFFENKMKIAGTGRNWNTVNTLLEIAEKKRK